MKRFDDSKISEELDKLGEGWSVEGGKLEKNFGFDDFMAALNFANQVGGIAEKRNHHPDLTVSWGELGFSVMTHDADGLTAKDFDLAQEVEAAYRNGA